MEESKMIEKIIKELGYKNEYEANEIIQDIKNYLNENNINTKEQFKNFLNELKKMKEILIIDDSEFDED